MINHDNFAISGTPRPMFPAPLPCSRVAARRAPAALGLPNKRAVIALDNFENIILSTPHMEHEVNP